MRQLVLNRVAEVLALHVGKHSFRCLSALVVVVCVQLLSVHLCLCVGLLPATCNLSRTGEHVGVGLWGCCL